MKKACVLFVALLIEVMILTNVGYTQEIAKLKMLYPQIGFLPDFSQKAQKEMELAKKIYNEKIDNAAFADFSIEERMQKLPREERILLKKYDATKESIWDVTGEGDDWYNLGGPYKVKATSELKSENGNTYYAKNAHDFSFKTVWAEGIKGNGIGEALLYYFKPLSPRITKIIIYNGYLKTPGLWRANSRVKQLKMYINNRPYAIMELKDTTAQQIFSIDPLRSNNKNQDLILRFEILAVYPGEKYDDTVITELYFDGIDVL